ncbi:MAG: hypothetical protein V4465_01765 [Patescibacteria group bacterium]
MEHPKKPIVYLAIAGVIIIGASLAYWYQHKTIDPKKFSSETIEYSRDTKGLPQGFLSNIPVEVENITTSETLLYPERKATVMNVTYQSSKQQEELSSIYASYLKNEGYTITTSSKTAEKTVYAATKDKNELNVTISPQSGRMGILLSYVVRGE